MTTSIAVMAKVPEAGRSKTRLVPHVSPGEAAGLSAAFLADVTANLALAATRASIVAYVAYAPAGSAASFDGIVAAGTRLLLADGSGGQAAGVVGFGCCLLGAVRAMLDRGHDAACVLNADSPNLPTRLLVAAQATLARQDCIVMGPAEDGGYYLLGMRRARPGLFAGIDWSTGLVAEQTRARAETLGLPLVELEPWYDVDEPATLIRLAADLSDPACHDAYAAPRTASFIATLGLQSRRPDAASAILNA